MEELCRQIGELLLDHVPLSDRRRSSRASVEATYAPADATRTEGCAVRGECQYNPDGRRLPLSFDGRMAGLFLRLRHLMESSGHPWERASFVLFSSGRFELDFDYE